MGKRVSDKEEEMEKARWEGNRRDECIRKEKGSTMGRTEEWLPLDSRKQMFTKAPLDRDLCSPAH